MAEITVRLVYNLETGKKDIYVDLRSDSDALPVEHEQHHKSIIEQLLGQGVITESEVGRVISGRATESQTPQAPEQRRPEKN